MDQGEQLIQQICALPFLLCVPCIIVSIIPIGIILLIRKIITPASSRGSSRSYYSSRDTTTSSEYSPLNERDTSTVDPWNSRENDEYFEKRKEEEMEERERQEKNDRYNDWIDEQRANKEREEEESRQYYEEEDRKWRAQQDDDY